MRKIALLVLSATAVLGTAVPSWATHGGAGNGAPNGAHYNLNIIGVSDPKTSDMTDSNRHTIFVPLSGNAKIRLCESGTDCGDGSFQVLDGNGTDGNGALFALPNPDPDGDGTTVYSVFARALGKPGGKSETTACATGPGADGVLGTEDDEVVCSVATLVLERTKGGPKFQNVSKELLYVYADVDGDGVVDRLSLFDDRAQDYFWDYSNNGLRLAQLRFYECASIVPDATDPAGATLDTDCISGTH
jgi:hypothetical protein